MSTLEQDYTTVPGQLYACLSVIGPEAPQKNDKFGIKIRGAFNSREKMVLSYLYKKIDP